MLFTLKSIVILHLLLVVFIGIMSLHLRAHNPAKSSLMLYRQYFYQYPIQPVHFIPLSEIPESFALITVATEDIKFWQHKGINITAIKWAYVVNKHVGYRMYGGSTITQQLARTMFLIPKKWIVRKYAEMIIALEMELFLSKQRILELYLNYCEWGKGIFGVAQAAQYHYQTDINHLSLDQSTRLITILANPLDYGPYSFQDQKMMINRYYTMKFRYYTYQKFQDIGHM